MSEHMRKHHTEQKNKLIFMHHQGVLYRFPKEVAKKYQVKTDNVSTEGLFAAVNKKYGCAGALLKGVRIREGLTQMQMAKKLKVTQSDISQMENGRRAVGRVMAKRIEKLFDVNYRSFLE